METAHNGLMTGKTVLITGATSGIGKVAATELAGMGAQVIVHGRNAEKAAAVQQEIIRSTGNSQVSVLLGDLSEKACVLGLAEAVSNKYKKLDVLVNNAGGVMNKQREETTDGWEKTIALNVLAPFMLSALLYPKLQAAGEGRIINVSSAAHRMAKARLDDFMYEKDYKPLRAYGDAKLYVILLGQEFMRRTRRFSQHNVAMNALHPGVVATNFAGESNSIYNFFFKFFRLFLISPEKGADTMIYLASQPEGAQHGGGYYIKRKPAKIHFSGDVEAMAIRVWELCERYTGIPFLPVGPPDAGL
jgi:retinol dehydrogenase-12